METENLLSFVSITFGGIILSLGCTLVGIYAVRGNILPVMLGYFLFMAGYELSRVKATNLFQPHYFKRIFHRREYRQIIMAILGLSAVSFGTLEVTKMLFNGFTSYYFFSIVLVLIGYMLVHKSVNEVII